MLAVSNHMPLKFKEFEAYKRIEERISKCPYEGSAFEGLKSLSSKAKGSEIEKLVEECVRTTQPEAVFTKNVNSDHDRVIDGVKYEIKGSFLWKGIETFRWQQIRPDYDTDYYIFVAIYPDRAEFYQAAKQDVEDYVIVKDAEGNWPYAQHGGKNKDSKLRPDTFWITGRPSDFPFMKLAYTVPGE